MVWNSNSHWYGNQYDRAQTDAKFRQLGGSITAFELYCIRGCLDYFISQGANENKLGVAGLSYGGMYALHLAAIDTRIKACYSSSWLCDSYTLPMPDWSYKNALNTFSVAETGALVCPRALVVGMGKNDDLFDYKNTQKEFESIKEYYTCWGCPDRLKLVVYDGGHEVNKNDEEMNFFFNSLEDEKI